MRSWREAQGRYQAKLKEEHIVASTTVLLRDGKVIEADNFGVGDIVAKRPTDLKSIYHWGSVTKTFTSIAILQLRDKGLLKLDDPVVRYVPNFAQVHDSFGKIETITLRDLLTHSAGLRNVSWPWNAGKAWEPFEPPAYAQLEAMFPYTEIEFKPGSKYSYSNLGYAILGEVIEAVSHEPYVGYVDKHIFKPLKMYDSYFNLTPDHLKAFRVQSYAVTDAGALVDQGGDFDTGATVANGGLNAPVGDMIAYVRFLSGAGSEDEYRFVLSRDEHRGPAHQDPALGRRGGGRDLSRPGFPHRRDRNAAIFRSWRVPAAVSHHDHGQPGKPHGLSSRGEHDRPARPQHRDRHHRRHGDPEDLRAWAGREVKMRRNIFAAIAAAGSAPCDGKLRPSPTHRLSPDDLKQVDAIVGSRKMILFGEDAHRLPSIQRAVAQTFRHLVETKHVRLLVFESAWGVEDVLSDFMASDRTTFSGREPFFLNAFASPETAGLLVWIRDWNRAHPEGQSADRRVSARTTRD